MNVIWSFVIERIAEKLMEEESSRSQLLAKKVVKIEQERMVIK